MPTVTIAHARGRAIAPAQPQRLVTLTVEATDAALSLGMRPVGTVQLPQGDRYGRWLRDRAAGAMDVGLELRPNIERIVALKPDLILGSNVRHGMIYGRLQAIAPTVLSETLGATWQGNMRLYGEALGKAPEAYQWLQTWQRDATALRDRLGPTPPTLAFVRFLPGSVRLYLGQSFSGTILQAAGFRGPARNQPDGFADLLSLEALGRIDTDFLIYSADSDRYRERPPDWLTSDLWTRLKVVQRGRARGFDDSIWAAGCGPQAARFALEDLNRWLLPRDRAAAMAP